MDVAWLGEPHANEPAVVGGKAASLSRLAAGYRVPPGFALTARALGLAAPDLARGVVPLPLRAHIAEAYGALGEGRVAVRSSAIDEDGDAHSFAGQHETFLNVEGVDPIAEAVVLCFASAFTARALDYRLHVGLPVDHIGLAILVQSQILADSAGVVFSANPITGSLDEIVITMSYGLGESIVGGTTTPDTFIVRKCDLAIVSRTIGEKRLMTVPVPGGTRELETPAFLRDLPSVTDELVLELAALALRLEADQGAPVDIECAVKGTDVYLLQSRPITTLRQAGAERSVS
jgi:phosphoenolpyruvate synthase/pyruvate phosphate dikinase